MAAVSTPRSEGEPRDLYHLTPIAVIADLAELRGPVSGLVQLPAHLRLSPKPTRDISIERNMLLLYAVVLREAKSDEDLRNFLDGATLIRAWLKISLPTSVRNAWESRHPQLKAVQSTDQDGYLES